MRNQFLRILTAAVGFVALSGIAQAQIRQETVVNVRFAFVVSGTTLPAGSYTISRFSDDKLEGLILTNYERHVSVFVRPGMVEDARADKPSVSFERVNGSFILSKIETAYDIYSIPVSRVDFMEAAKSHDATLGSAAAAGK